MSKFPSILNGLLTLFAQLQVPTYATAAAGFILPILTLLGVTNLSVAAVGADLVVFGGLCATLERVLPGGLLNPAKPTPPKPTPPAPPAK